MAPGGESAESAVQTVDYSQEPRVYSLNQAGHRSNKHLPDRHLSKRFRCGTENANEQCPLALQTLEVLKSSPMILLNNQQCGIRIEDQQRGFQIDDFRFGQSEAINSHRISSLRLTVSACALLAHLMASFAFGELKQSMFNIVSNRPTNRNGFSL